MENNYRLRNSLFKFFLWRFIIIYPILVFAYAYANLCWGGDGCLCKLLWRIWDYIAPTLWVLLCAVAIAFVFGLSAMGAFIYAYDVLMWGYERGWLMFLLSIPVALLIIVGVAVFLYIAFFT